MTAKFWVGGTGTWDNSTTTHWSLSTGGAGGAAVPGSGDTITFDGSSGGGTVTVDTTINGLTFQSITSGAFTGTLDFSINNPSITLTTSFSSNGAGTRTLKLGSGTFTISSNNGSIWDCFGASLTLVAGTSTIAFTATSPVGGMTVQLGSAGVSYSTITFAAVSNGFTTSLQANSSATIGTLTFAAPRNMVFHNGATLTITNAFTWTGTSSTPFSFESDSGGSAATISVATGAPAMDWASIRNLTFTGGATFTATNSLNLGGNTGITITAPTSGGGGGGGIIGS